MKEYRALRARFAVGSRRALCSFDPAYPCGSGGVVPESFAYATIIARPPTTGPELELGAFGVDRRYLRKAVCLQWGGGAAALLLETAVEATARLMEDASAGRIQTSKRGPTLDVRGAAALPSSITFYRGEAAVPPVLR